MLALLVGASIAGGQINYPATRTDGTTDTLHGVVVADPFRWLEQDVRKAEEVADWVERQNRVTDAFLGSIPERAAIRSRLTELWDYERFSTPSRHGGWYYMSVNDGLQNQSVVVRMRELGGEHEVFLDPNTWSEDGTVALSGTEFSDDGRYVAYAKSEAGSDWRTWHVLDTQTMEHLPERIRWTKFGGLSWTPDGKGFFYSRYPSQEGGTDFVTLNENQMVYYHRLFTPQESDVLVYERPDEPRWGFAPGVTDDGRYLILTVYQGTDDKYRVFYRDLSEPYAGFVRLIDAFENEWSFIANDGPVFYFKTDLEAPLGRVVSLDISGDAGVPVRERIGEVIGESRDTLRGVGMVNNLFVASYLQDAKTAVRLFDTDGRLVREVSLPGIGSADGFGGERADTETFYSFSSFATPPSNYRYDMFTGESTLLQRAEVDFDPDKYEVKQVFFTSRDGTRVPMFLAHRKGIELDGSNPTLLYGYGGFNIPLTPGFSVTRLAWMEMGGVVAVANLRGGGEYGKDWHMAGTKLEKQNVFDDFIAAAEWLIDNKYTRPDRLAIQGGSNGGLLVGAVMTQRPDLFGAALPAVGVMDMLRFHKFTIGWAWIDDYGSADDPDEFRALYAYSPYHQLLRQGDEGVAYPATLVTTADTDDRVVPGHSFKFAAALQAAQSGEDPVLIRIETRAGHGAGKPTSKRIEEAADLWAFLVKTLDFDPEMNR
ncbi:MAG: prolyl oligopeptidase family serine peptidase [Phycisphaerales bacterium]